MPVQFISHGYDTTALNPYNEDAWGEAHSDSPIGSARYGVSGPGDWKVSIVANADRTVSIAQGSGWGCGITDETDGNETLQFPPSASGVRWDTVAVRRDWTPTAGVSKFVIIPGGSTRAVSGSRVTGPGQIDEQPIALVAIKENQTQPDDVVDLRCWAANGGVYAKDDLARQYINQVGSMVTIGDTQWQLVLGENDTPSWVVIGGAFRGPSPLTLNGNYRHIGTHLTEPMKDGAVSRSGQSVSLEGGVANKVPIQYLANTAYIIATFDKSYAPKVNSAPFPQTIVGLYQCQMWATPAGEIRVSFKVPVPEQAIGAMVFPLSGLGWNQ
ncbi:hypothetical protein [Arthrobacter sp. EpRS71]|uniref:hypothetical protein n=1 Tax=Arthrobacter sp. EpRS71 TaxID=1743141 RepID=UPI0007498CB6|nr:hypothetical protein [Arthrobacter sp. EpRS71]KUM34529.1 hypothetical protein AR689_10320 [Arthrobacter sp. EpRS71]